jgi:ribonuclease P/MRP protein subunit POP3
VTASKGKRNKKRKRADAKPTSDVNEQIQARNDPTRAPRPVMETHITIGFNSTIRCLGATLQSAKNSKPIDQIIASKHNKERTDQNNTSKYSEESTDYTTTTQNEETKSNDRFESQYPNQPKKRLSTIFLTHSTDYLPYQHLPTLTAQIARSDPSATPILLVPLPDIWEAKLSAALGVPRVGVVGIYDDAPGSAALLGYVHDKVPPVDVPWIKEAGEGQWLGSNVLSGGKTGEREKISAVIM